ncbi:hypothetical protein LCGC14_2021770 [marine sediment metagenome]|uniref:Uncharacterized protein n=1 Tax=marine sediment metagenome TaxID=412755 RepID=A0A0F9EXI8_9ZZZZ
MVDKPDIRDSDDKFLYDLRHDPTGEIATLTGRLEAVELERDQALSFLNHFVNDDGCKHPHPRLADRARALLLNPQQRPVKTNEEGEGG